MYWSRWCSAPAKRYFLWISSIASGCVKDNKSLFPWLWFPVLKSAHHGNLLQLKLYPLIICSHAPSENENTFYPMLYIIVLNFFIIHFFSNVPSVLPVTDIESFGFFFFRWLEDKTLNIAPMVVASFLFLILRQAQNDKCCKKQKI